MSAATKITEPLFDSSVAYEAPCISCGTNVEVSSMALEICRTNNHILKRMGEKLMSKSEIAMCRGCYLKHNEAMWDKERARSDAYVKVWNEFKQAYRVAKDDEQRSMLEKRLRNGLRDYWPSYSAMFTAWKSELNTRRSKGLKDSTGKAGF